MTQMTRHAQVRTQQRSIPPMLIDLLLQFGESEPAGDGATKVFFNKTSRKQFKAYAGPLARILEEYLDVYVVVNEADQVITTAHRTERIRRH